MTDESPVRELRLAVTVKDFDAALRFYREVLGLPEVEAWNDPTGRGAVLDAGRATLELIDESQADFIDEVEVGECGVAPPIRVALEVADSEATSRALAETGSAELLGGPVTTPWNHRNVRVKAPALQLTLFTVLPDGSVESSS